jgi:dUTP pyrophosphatase
MRVKIVNKSRFPNPEYAHPSDSGMDLRANIDEPFIFYSGTTTIVPTGIFVKLPDNLEFQIRSRSGLAAKHNIFVVNSPGTIDSGYTGEIKVILRYLGPGLPITIDPGDKIAQMVLCPVIKCDWVPVNHLEETDRNENGFGSTG